MSHSTCQLGYTHHSPYMKPNNEIFYVHKRSNHPKEILKNLPKNIENRLSKISANEDIFNDAIPPYQATLDASEYDHKLTFDSNARDTNQRRKNNNRNRNVTWFNPPWSNSVKSNIGAQFLAILKETFPPTHQLYKICNRNTIKLSYRCMPNMRREINKHNNKILKGEDGAAVQNELFDCNCRPQKRRETCKVMPGIGCQVSNVVYKATVTRADTSQVETYTGSTAQTIKGRYNGHQYDIKHPEKSGTCLSKHIHKLIGQGIDYTMKWEILKRSAPWNPITNICRLCVLEKHHILFNPEDSSLNQRSEFFTVCRHKEKHLLMKT